MTDKTWVKLYRKLDESELIRDANALQVFNWLLLNVDRKTGEVTVSRGWLSKYLRQNPNTFYAVVTRLKQKYNMISTTTTNNNQATVIRLLNWAKYQSAENVTTTPNKRLTNDRQTRDNNITRIENKELKRETEPSSSNYLLALPTNDLAEFTLAFNCTDRQVINKAQSLYDYCQARGKKYKDYKAFLRNALRRDFGDRVQPPTVEQNLPEEMSAEGLERLRAMKEQLLVSKLKN